MFVTIPGTGSADSCGPGIEHLYYLYYSLIDASIHPSAPPRECSGSTGSVLQMSHRQESTMSVNLKKITLGFIPANRGFFSAQLAAKMRKQTIEANMILIVIEDT